MGLEDVEQLEVRFRGLDTDTVGIKSCDVLGESKSDVRMHTSEYDAL